MLSPLLSSVLVMQQQASNSFLELRELATSRLECVTQPTSRSYLFSLGFHRNLKFLIIYFTSVAACATLDLIRDCHRVEMKQKTNLIERFSGEINTIKTNKKETLEKKERIAGPSTMSIKLTSTLKLTISGRWGALNLSSPHWENREMSLS